MDQSNRTEFAASIVRVVALHDKDTAVHLHATAVLAHRIAAQLRLSDEMAQTIELAGLLHDIGKVAVRRDILRKPGELTESEWIEVRLHAQIGAEVLDDIPALVHIAPIVRAHHERIDGCGYPDRLRGDEIPLEARIVAVADAFHTLTTDRPYRSAIMPNSALNVLTDAAGPQFDVNVVAALLKLFSGGRLAHRISA